MGIPPRAGQSRLDELFPAKTEDPKPGTFELGLVLGGTVSAGAYTAGALDFLLQALEAWAGSAPPHQVVLTTAAGTSGGAVCAAMLGLLSSRAVPHIAGDPTAPGATPSATGNPLWDVWVNDFDIGKLLATGDIDPTVDADAGTGVTPGAPPAGDGTPVQHTPSVLNCAMIDAAAAGLVSFAQSAAEVPRAFFSAPFRVAVTVSNLRGIPFAIRAIPAYDGFTGAAFVQHDDYAWFAFANGAQPVAQREDEFWLGTAAGETGFATLATFATASGSLPVGLVGRALTRPAAHYLYRPSVRPSLDPPGYTVDWIDPDWSELPEVQASGVYRFTAVDGGCFNNDPVRLVHGAMAGLIGRNPQSAGAARRAMLMIDPLADQPTALAPTGRSLVRVLGLLEGLFTQGARYLTADMDLFRDAAVFSRFQMVPVRPGVAPGVGRVGEMALAGSGLYAAAGWCARAFRVHDFLLGRANMQAYLRGQLVLASDNPLFAGWTPGMRADHAVDSTGARIAPPAAATAGYFLPILPDLTQTVAALPDWPVGAYDPSALHAPLVARLEAVLKGLQTDNLPGLLDDAAAVLAIPGIAALAATAVVGKLTADLGAAGLLAAQPAAPAQVVDTEGKH